MEIRELRPGDASRIQQVARESLSESYGHTFGEETIESVVGRWYDEERIEEIASDENSLFLIADNDDIHGYAEGEMLAGDTVIGDIHWLHVRPKARGQGFGSQLLGELVDRMETDGATLVRGRVVEVNEDGAAFYEEHGFERSGSEPIDIAGDEYEELVYEKHVEEGDEEILEPIEGDDGRQLYVDYTGGETGVLAPLYPTYLDGEREEQYGWLCRNCGSTETTMDSAGRIQCGNCENARSATRWDGSYL